MKEIEPNIINQAISGNQSACRSIYEYYAPMVWRVVYRSTGNEQMLAQEIVQDSFVKIFRSLKKFRNDSLLSTWIYRIAYNVAMTNLKRHSARNSSITQLSEAAQSTENTDRYETQQLLTYALGTLSVEDRFLLTAREVDGLTFEELELVTKKNSGSLRTRLSRIKEELRNIFIDMDRIQDLEINHGQNRATVLSRTGTDT